MSGVCVCQKRENGETLITLQQDERREATEWVERAMSGVCIIPDHSCLHHGGNLYLNFVLFLRHLLIIIIVVSDPSVYGCHCPRDCRHDASITH